MSGTKKKALAAGIICLVVLLLGLEMCREAKGPSPEVAFKRYIADPIPPTVSDLVMNYSSGLKGFCIMMCFKIAPEDLNKLWDLGEFHPPLPEEGIEDVCPMQDPEFEPLDPKGWKTMRRFFLRRTSKRASTEEIHIRVDKQRVYYRYAFHPDSIRKSPPHQEEGE